MHTQYHLYSCTSSEEVGCAIIDGVAVMRVHDGDLHMYGSPESHSHQCMSQDAHQSLRAAPQQVAESPLSQFELAV